MTIWILAILLVASLIGLGLRQGAIRVAASLIGIVLGAWLAGPLGNMLKPLFAKLGMNSPTLLWAVPPVVVFVLILTLAKVAGLFVHKKTEVFYKYKAGDLRLALWERLNSRLGMCLGTLNALAYGVIAAQVIYLVSYWTYQAQSDSDTATVRVVNRLGKDLESTGMTKVAAAVDDTSATFYDAADITGLLYQTPELQSRLAQYPAVLSLAERQEFQELVKDEQFRQMLNERASIAEILKHQKLQGILNNAELMGRIDESVVPNLKDMRAFLETGSSEKFQEPILGRWRLDVNGTLGLFRRERPNMTSKQMTNRKNVLLSVASANLVITPENQVYLKGVPFVRAESLAPNVQSSQGEWRGQDGRYQLSVTVDGKTEQLTAELHGTRLQITGGDLLGLAFSRGT